MLSGNGSRWRSWWPARSSCCFRCGWVSRAHRWRVCWACFSGRSALSICLYNLFPSLHITLRTILAATYARHTFGPLRLASHLWFSLIGFSTIFTYQHQVVDIAGGFVLAAACFYAVREQRHDDPVILNPRIGAYYTVPTNH